MERLEEVPSVAALIKERNELQAKVTTLSAALAHPWPRTPEAMQEWLDIRKQALSGVDYAVKSHVMRIQNRIEHEIQHRLSKLANHIYNKQEKDYPSNVLDMIHFWITGPIRDFGGGVSEREKWWSKVTQEVDQKLALEAAEKAEK